MEPQQEIHPSVQTMMNHYNNLPPEHIAQIGIMHPEIQKAFNKLQAPQAKPLPPVMPSPNQHALDNANANARFNYGVRI